jgi:hypothetical protein
LISACARVVPAPQFTLFFRSSSWLVEHAPPRSSPCHTLHAFSTPAPRLPQPTPRPACHPLRLVCSVSPARSRHFRPACFPRSLLLSGQTRPLLSLRLAWLLLLVFPPADTTPHLSPSSPCLLRVSRAQPTLPPRLLSSLFTRALTKTPCPLSPFACSPRPTPPRWSPRRTRTPAPGRP